MALKIIRNDITKMQVDAIVNPANPKPKYSAGTDAAIYRAAGEEELLAARSTIGELEEGEVAVTPGFNLPAKNIIHAVSPIYVDGSYGEEKKLRSCYRASMELAIDRKFKSIAIPLLGTGSFGYPKDEGLRIALDEISYFLMKHELQVYLVLFDQEAVDLIRRVYPTVIEFVSQQYVDGKREEEYGGEFLDYEDSFNLEADTYDRVLELLEQKLKTIEKEVSKRRKKAEIDEDEYNMDDINHYYDNYGEEADVILDRKLESEAEGMKAYLLYVLNVKGISKKKVFENAGIPRQIAFNIWRNKDYRLDKVTVLKLCVGARLNLDEAKILMEKAGYAFSPNDKRDIIFSHYIEHGLYNIRAINEALESYGLPRVLKEDD